TGNEKELEIDVRSISDQFKSVCVEAGQSSRTFKEFGAPFHPSFTSPPRIWIMRGFVAFQLIFATEPNNAFKCTAKRGRKNARGDEADHRHQPPRLNDQYRLIPTKRLNWTSTGQYRKYLCPTMVLLSTQNTNLLRTLNQDELSAERLAILKEINMIEQTQ
ncbi:5054_t:CDS:2, partial [Acaulospora colombiana]